MKEGGREAGRQVGKCEIERQGGAVECKYCSADQ